jgi:hypothetical protein
MLLLDSAFGIFDNIQPRIDLCELDLQLPCDLIYFKTVNYQEMAINSHFPYQKMKVLDAYQKLFIAPRSATGCSDTAKIPLNCWDMLIMIHRMYLCLSLTTCQRARSLFASDPHFANSSLFTYMAPNLFQPTFTHVANIGVPVCHGLGSSEARNPELESLLGRNEGFHSAEELARNGLRNLSR